MPANPWSNSTKPIAIAHRGGAGAFSFDRYHRENTLEVFQAAIKLGYEYLELDVALTADGQVIVIHVTTDRTEAMLHKNSAPNAQKIQSLTYAELKRCLNRPVPTLDTVVRKFPQTKFFIDSKTDEVVEPLAQVVIKARAYNRVYLNSFYLKRIAHLQQLLGDRVIYGLIIGRYPLIINRKYRALKRGKYQNSGLSYIVFHDWFMEKGMVELIHRQGFKALIWGPNTRAKIERAIETGVDGIMSDNISLLKEILGINKQKERLNA